MNFTFQTTQRKALLPPSSATIPFVFHQNESNNVNYNHNNNHNYSSLLSMSAITNNSNSNSKNNSNSNKPEYNTVKLLWGPVIWNLLHTLACKIKLEYFNDCKYELYDIIYSIVINLPCPTCSMHAKEYFQKINFQAIQNKTEFITLLFTFHNEVNKKKQNPLFDYHDIHIYEKAITFNVVHFFLQQFNKKNNTGAVRMLTDDLHRRALATKLQNYFLHNLYKYDP
jgi:hypothetical protein